MAAALAYHARHRILRPSEAIHQNAVRLGLFQRIQVRALDVLDDRDFEHLDVVHLVDHDRHLGQARRLRRAPAAFASDNLPDAVLARLGPHQDRLQHPLVADRGGQFLQILLAEGLARLVRIGLQAFDRHALHAGGHRRVRCDRRLGVLPHQRRQAAAQTSLSFSQDTVPFY